MARPAVREVSDPAARSSARVNHQEAAAAEGTPWRAGKPAEDPEKTKRWGFVTAKPSEYLVHMRKGRVRPRSSGQGASCFKWPWDSVAVIPTTLQRLYFSADQVTAEKVGVAVRGLAVYRVARPELAVRMLNFSYPERAQEKLAETLRDMFVGAVRRLVANLTVEECLTRRKEALAAFLIAEIAPVVGGAGQAGDSTDRGWGVVLDTLEIQDVQILSEQVFANMQAPYRSQLALRAREAEVDRERALEEQRAKAAAQLRELRAQAESRAAQVEASEELKRTQAQAQAERARLETEREMERRRLEKESDLARARAEAEREAVGHQALLEAEARRARAQAGAQAAEAESAASEREAELKAQAQKASLARERDASLARIEGEAEAARERAKAAREASQARGALEAEEAERAQAVHRQAAAARADVQRLELEMARLQGELEAGFALRHKQLENAVSAAKLQSDFVNRALPEIARVFQQQFGKVEIIAGAGENPFGFLVHAFEGVMEIARRGGLSPAVEKLGAALSTPAEGGPEHRGS